ncbi:hypothetical protein QNJ39_08290 [Macrococcus caseolyticus]|uniref:hypothetical protein n=1 Tax=Macrococcoides caseolyticum TaxID=69966 RepID=UPI0024BD197C|nr:hypothetical protein [Macrococcus caseolyticus]MDJ1091594.1 hypothetical protein [Macrococcus caseolyticus]
MKQYRDIALKIAIEAHKNQKDKAGHDFINHPITVSKIIYDQFYDSIENLAIINARPLEEILDLLVSASYLHDVLEDTIYTSQTLRAKGIPLEIIKIVELLTREKDSGQTYFEYINKISKSQFATIIKLLI